MIPLRVDILRTRAAIFNGLLILVNVLAFLHEVTLSPGLGRALVYSFGLIPAHEQLLFARHGIGIGQAITVTLTNLTIRNGQAGAGNNKDQWGGGIHSAAASLTLNNVIVSGNRTGGLNVFGGGSGGGIDSESGTLTLNHSTVSGKPVIACVTIGPARTRHSSQRHDYDDAVFCNKSKPLPFGMK